MNTKKLEFTQKNLENLLKDLYKSNKNKPITMWTGEHGKDLFIKICKKNGYSDSFINSMITNNEGESYTIDSINSFRKQWDNDHEDYIPYEEIELEDED